MQGVDGNPRSVIPRTRTSRRQFVFGGVAFEVLADKTLHWELPADYERHVVEQGSTPVFADVICSVSMERSLPPIAALPCAVPCFRQSHERTAIFSREVRADLSRVASSRYAAAARVTPGTDGISALLLGIASAIARVEGGLCLRAVGVAIEERLVLLVGPKGAGKTTAANLCVGGQLFAAQRVNLVYQAEQWIAHSLPGDAAIELPPSAQLGLPVAAIARVRRGSGEPKLSVVAPADRTAVLRDAIELSDLSADAEQVREDRLAQCSQNIAMFELHSVLGKPLGALLRSELLA